MRGADTEAVLTLLFTQTPAFAEHTAAVEIQAGANTLHLIKSTPADVSFSLRRDVFFFILLLDSCLSD